MTDRNNTDETQARKAKSTTLSDALKSAYEHPASIRALLILLVALPFFALIDHGRHS